MFSIIRTSEACWIFKIVYVVLKHGPWWRSYVVSLDDGLALWCAVTKLHICVLVFPKALCSALSAIFSCVF
jgi:hypothetical protein